MQKNNNKKKNLSKCTTKDFIASYISWYKRWLSAITPLWPIKNFADYGGKDNDMDYA